MLGWIGCFVKWVKYYLFVCVWIIDVCLYFCSGFSGLCYDVKIGLLGWILYGFLIFVEWVIVVVCLNCVFFFVVNK